MQAITPVTSDQLLAPGQVPLMKLEIYIEDAWINLCDFNNKNYVESISISLGGASMTPAPIGGAWSATLSNENSIFHSNHPTSEYKDYFKTGRKIRMSLGAKYGIDWRDDFNDASIDPLWTKHNDDVNRTIIETSLLTITIAGATEARWVSSLNEAPKLYQAVPAVPFTIIAKLPAYAMPTNSVGYGIFIGHYDADQINERKAYKFEKKRAGDGSKYIQVNRIHSVGGGENSDNYSVLDEDADIWLKIEVDADEDVRFYASDDEENWFQMKRGRVPYTWSGFFDSEMEIGLFVASNVVPEVIGKFDYFKLLSGAGDSYWQRIIGYMNVPKFSIPDYKVSVNGGDYMKLLQETELRSPDNYWGTSQIFSSISSEGFAGDEIYTEEDSMDIHNEIYGPVNWDVHNCTFEAESDTGGGSEYVGGMINSDGENFVENVDVGTLTYGKEYKASFKYRRVTGAGSFAVWFYQYVDEAWKSVGHTDESLESESYATAVAYIKPLTTGALKMMLRIGGGISQEFRIDQISIKEFIPYYERYYDLPEACKGPYRVLLESEDVWQGEEDEGWFYVEDAEPGPPAHPARIVFFDINKTVSGGTDDLVIYYFTTESPENTVADILVKANLYADRATALDAMEYTATEITIDKIWFKPGTTCLNAIKKLCERCDYRFYFKHDGIPVFKPKPAPEETSFTFTDPKHISSFVTYQDRSEIRNRIVIEGMKQAEPVNKEETMPPELKGEDYNQDSIDAYGERTLTIKNHLFQTQAAIDAMTASLLAEYKDPKWYTDLEMPFNPVPLEKGDKIQWEERLSPVLNITKTGMIRDIKISNFNTIYICELL